MTLPRLIFRNFAGTFVAFVQPLPVKVMSEPVDSEADESRTRFWGTKRNLAPAEGVNSDASTPNKRRRSRRRGLQNHRDFVPTGGSFSTSDHLISATSSDADGSSGSSAPSAHDPESHRTWSTDMEGSTSGPHTTTPNSSGEHSILGQNRLITGFAKTHNQPSTATHGEASEVSRNDSTSHNSIGESADDAIEISDDTDMEDQSEDGGMVINVDDESEDGASNPEGSLDSSLSHFRVTGWTQTQAGTTDSGIPKLCSYLERKAAHFGKLDSPYKILRRTRAGDALIISVLPEAAQRFAELDGVPFSHTNLTVRAVANQAPPQNETSLSDGEILERDKHRRVLTRRGKRQKCRQCGEKGHKKSRCLNPQNLQTGLTSSTQTTKDNAHEQLQGDLEHSLSLTSVTTPMTVPGVPPQRLGDLSADEFENQVRYTLFHLKRDQIDPNRPAICTTCLQGGHQETSCPESNCLHCGVKDEHPSRLCPKYRRCLKCRERGHDVDTCISKLKNNTVPCDHCGSEEHLEDSCPLRFFPSQSKASATELKLWISCCICASKTHLVGDCPERHPSSQAATWSLRSLNPMQISNLGLESGTRKMERSLEIRGVRQDGLTVKGRADTHGPVQPHRDGNDRPSMQPAPGSQDDSPRRSDRNRFDAGDSERNRGMGGRRRGVRDDFYRPSSDSRPLGVRYDRYETSYMDYRDQSNDRRDKFYATDSFGQRRRSRSPESRSFRGAQPHHGFQPPLPKELLPTRPPPSSRQGFRSSAQQEERRPTVDRGPPGVDSYRPMPSAAKKAWNKHRL